MDQIVAAVVPPTACTIYDTLVAAVMSESELGLRLQVDHTRSIHTLITIIDNLTTIRQILDKLSNVETVSFQSVNTWKAGKSQKTMYSKWVAYFL